MISAPSRTILRRSRSRFFSFALLLAIFVIAPKLRADEPYARSRDYDLQHSKIVLRFDVEQRKVLGDVTHSLAILRDGTAKIAFDSVGLTIQSVAVNKSPARFETPWGKLIIPLPTPAKAGDKFDVAIRYEGHPAKGLYFILPDKDYPHRPRLLDHRFERQARECHRRRQGPQNLVLERVPPQLHLPDHRRRRRIRRSERHLARNSRHVLRAQGPRRSPAHQLRPHSGDAGTLQQKIWRRLPVGKIRAGHGR